MTGAGGPNNVTRHLRTKRDAERSTESEATARESRFPRRLDCRFLGAAKPLTLLLERAALATHHLW